jgi:hypothetical protein
MRAFDLRRAHKPLFSAPDGAYDGAFVIARSVNRITGAFRCTMCHHP